MTTEPIDFTDNVLYGEDLYLRFCHLEAEAELRDLTEDERDEFRMLERCSHGLLELRDLLLIHEDHFVDHARDTAEELLGVNTSEWPYTCIDWEDAARDLRVDYDCVEFPDGTAFYAG